MSSIPDLPGRLVEPAHSELLKEVVSNLCGIEHRRFPGSQPVSFKTSDLTRLQKEDYWVCEKSDGVRVLMLIVPFPNGQEVYLIDRKNSYRQLTGLYFPHYEDRTRPLGHSLIDGELVLDIDPITKAEIIRFLAFDCLVFDAQNIMPKSLDKRYGRLMRHFIPPYLQMLKEYPNMASGRPFDVQVKKMELAYAVEKVVREDMPKLQHGTDGLIYTCAESGYVIGTDNRLLKWKAPSENSIDFKLELRFPPIQGRPSEPDYAAKPVFILNVYHGDDRQRREARYEYFDMMEVDNLEWERMKASGEQYDDRIVEVAWNVKQQNWRFLRFRDDKHDGNHISVVQNIIESIQDGVEVDALLSSAQAVKTAFKARSSIRAQTRSQSHQSHQHPQPPPPPPPPVQSRDSSSAVYNRVSGPLTVGGLSR